MELRRALRWVAQCEAELEWLRREAEPDGEEERLRGLVAVARKECAERELPAPETIPVEIPVAVTRRQASGLYRDDVAAALARGAHLREEIELRQARAARIRSLSDELAACDAIIAPSGRPATLRELGERFGLLLWILSFSLLMAIGITLLWLRP